VNLRDALAPLEGVHAHGGYFTARCPAHDDRNASLSIREGEGGKVLIKCFAGCNYRAVIDALEGRPWRQGSGLPAGASSTLAAAPDDAERIKIARRIWRAAKPAIGTLVDTYLRSRGITMTVSASLRFHANLKHPTGAYLPAMVAAVQDAEGAIVAIHRTFLKADGSGKANVEQQKMMLGPCAGGAVRLAKPASTISIAEGIETALSIAQACPDLAVWAALSTSGMRALRLPDVVRDVIIAADSDDAGEQAAQAAAAGLLCEGLRVRIARPPTGRDFNDLLTEGDR
jgi:putative DNA primase/helicase